ncbi:hypothetical protein BDV96DRAFT_561935 [Lophiotrema nucula]|uniref:Uncharacterized protein n=1 Tax=Lophiotrema nucula TaxID=690887 RepID=A0A6A5ZTV4_9PLEO|nr:hypothetical protein BDV96DRAFT_561935 [Lophiotrema nucula]
MDRREAANHGARERTNFVCTTATAREQEFGHHEPVPLLTLVSLLQRISASSSGPRMPHRAKPSTSPVLVEPSTLPQQSGITAMREALGNRAKETEVLSLSLAPNALVFTSHACSLGSCFRDVRQVRSRSGCRQKEECSRGSGARRAPTPASGAHPLAMRPSSPQRLLVCPRSTCPARPFLANCPK